MPIGAGLGLAAAGSVAGGVIGANATKSAAKSAAASSAESNALAKSIYDSNTVNLTPFMQRGNAAGEQINALLGLPGATGANIDWTAYAKAMPDAWAQWTGDPTERQRWGNDLSAFGKFHYENDGSQRDLSAFTTRPASASASALSAFDAFRNSAGYQDRVAEMNKAINTGYAARGALESGAAQKALQDRSNVLAGDYFGQYLSALQGQQQTGMAGASALAGVGQNFAATTAANNNAAATTAGNSALAQAQIWGNAINGLTSSAGLALGSSYRR